MEANCRVVVVLDGCTFHRRDSKWYDKRHIGVSEVVGIQLSALVRQRKEWVDAIVLEDRHDQLDRHARCLKSLGLPYMGAGPSTSWGNRWARCWACHHPLGSATDLECYACHWILCRCGACGCAYVRCTRAA